MSMARGIKLCARVFQQLGLQRLPTTIQIRHYRPDEPNDWQINKNYGDGSFDPRLDTRHYKIYNNEGSIDGIRKSIRETESRRRITQDTVDHQRRQARIIEDNRRKWESRAEPKSPGVLQYEKIISNRKQHQKSEDQRLAEEYSRKRRQSRLIEKERQERELRESRKGYNLPNPEIIDNSSTEADGRQMWMDRKHQENEEKYWHTWSTCPEERCSEKDIEEAEDQQNSEDNNFGFKSDDRRGFIKPTQPYDSTVRRFQTHSRQITEPSTQYIMAEPPKAESEHLHHKDDNRDLDQQRDWKNTSVKTRRPSGMVKQYWLAQHKLNNSQTSLLDHGFLRRSRSANDEHVNETYNEVAEQFPNTKLYWRGLPPAVSKRFDDINRAVAQKNGRLGEAKKCVEPPRYKLTVRSGNALRRRPPIDSFSSTLAVDTHFTPYSEYTGYSRQTICDAWKHFKHIHSLKPLY